MGVFAWFLSTCVDVLGCIGCAGRCFWWVGRSGSRVVGFALQVFPRVKID